jgi:hypothetical protein
MNINSRKSQKLIRKAVNKALRKHVGELATAIAADVVAGLAVKIADQPTASKNRTKPGKTPKAKKTEDTGKSEHSDSIAKPERPTGSKSPAKRARKS